MKVYYSEYSLIPKKAANRLSSLDLKKGVLLKGVLKDKTYFADYFPHSSLGDRPVEQFLPEFKFQEEEYDRKVFDLMLRDFEFQNASPRKFFNHQLYSKGDDIKSPVLKYKIQGPDDFGFLNLLKLKCKVRLDANGLFSKEDYEKFVKEIPSKELVEYIEDPLSDKDWSSLSLPSARDFVQGETFEFYIYKPNCEFHPVTEKKIIFSSYLGGNFGRWHSCAELLQKGDLKLYHGIKTDGFYEEEFDFLSGDFVNGFVPDMSKVKSLYKKTADLNWKELCSM